MTEEEALKKLREVTQRLRDNAAAARAPRPPPRATLPLLVEEAPPPAPWQDGPEDEEPAP